MRIIGHEDYFGFAVALIDPDGRVLLAQRPEGKSMAGLWEFASKVEAMKPPKMRLSVSCMKNWGSKHGPAVWRHLRLRRTLMMIFIS